MNRLGALGGESGAIDESPRKRKPGGKRRVGGKKARAAAAAAAAEFSDAEFSEIKADAPPTVEAPPAVTPAVAAATATTSATVAIDVAPTVSVPEINLDEFSRQTREVMTFTEEIGELVLKYSQTSKDKLKVSDMKKRKAIGEEIENISKQIDDRINSAKSLLESMKAATDKIERDNVGVIKMRENQFGYLSRQFVDCIQTYSKAQQEGQDAMQAETERRVRQRLNAQGEQASEDDVRKIAMQVMQGQQNALFSAAKDELAMVQQNARDMQKIYDAMVGLEQLFRDFDVLVNEQGEVLDQIMSNVTKTENYVEKGMKNLVDAKKYQKKARNKFCCIILVVAVIFAVILAVVLGFSLPKTTF